MTGPGGPGRLGDARFPRWAELRSAAVAFARHDWPVLRGTYSVMDGGRQVWCGRDGAVGLRPVDTDWSLGCTTRAPDVAQWWAEQPFSVLVATGYGVDCAELPSPFGRSMLNPLRAAGVRLPIMLTPVNTVVLFIQSVRWPRPALTALSLRSTGNWIPVPPTEQGNCSSGGYRWLVAPGSVDWQLPDLSSVTHVIESATGR
ncbi:MAG: bifunctional DNA primase/polymerase [Geodermatophilaceae bacterium]|nr:bifunctional DNA primase/polymerase [Geodermatophilaceae bacterium]